MFIQRHWFLKTSCKNMEIVFNPSLFSSDFRGSSTGPIPPHGTGTEATISMIIPCSTIPEGHQRYGRQCTFGIESESFAGSAWRFGTSAMQGAEDDVSSGKRMVSEKVKDWVPQTLWDYTSSYKFMFSMKLWETYPVCQKQMVTFSIISQITCQSCYDVRWFVCNRGIWQKVWRFLGLSYQLKRNFPHGLVTPWRPWSRYSVAGIVVLKVDGSWSKRRWDKCWARRGRWWKRWRFQMFVVCCWEIHGNTLAIHGNTRKQLMFC